MSTGIGTLSDLLPHPVRDDRIHGVVIGVVTHVENKGGDYRVKVKFPWLGDDVGSNWARVVSPMAGADRGLFLPLVVDDEVAVMFAHGDPSYPYVIGALWNGKDAPPGLPPEGDELRYVLKSKSGHTVTLDDTKGKEKITVADKSGKNQIVIDSAANTVTIVSEKDVSITAKGDLRLSAQGSVTVDCARFSVAARQEYSIAADARGELKAQSGLALTCMAGVKINNDGLVVT